MRLLKKNAKLVREWSKKNQAIQKLAHKGLKDLSNLIKYGKIKKAMKKDLDLYKKLAPFFKDVRKTKVHRAITEEWIIAFTEDLKKLYMTLRTMGKGKTILDEVNLTLKNLPKKARADLDKTYGGILRKKDLKELEKRANKLQMIYKKEKKELIKKVRDGFKHLSIGLKFRGEKPFKETSQTIKTLLSKYQKRGMKSWNEAYKDHSVRTCIKGVKSKHYLSLESKITLALIGDRGKEIK